MYTRYPSLADRTVLVTGGGTGIGAALVRAFAANDAKVAFVDIQDAASHALVESLADARHRPRFFRCDLMDIAALEQVMAEIRAALGPIGVLVNNAANDQRHKTDEVTPAYFDQSIGVNLKHVFFACQIARRQMAELGGGSIVNLSSIAWMRGAPNLPIYAAAKAAITGLTRSLGQELGEESIRVNAIAPGAVITERQLELWYSEEQASAIAERQAIRRRLLPEEIARTALFLASDDSRMITKQTIIVDAGLL